MSSSKTRATQPTVFSRGIYGNQNSAFSDLRLLELKATPSSLLSLVSADWTKRAQFSAHLQYYVSILKVCSISQNAKGTVLEITLRCIREETRSLKNFTTQKVAASKV